MKNLRYIASIALVVFFSSSMVLCAAGKKSKDSKNTAKKADSTMMIPAENMRVTVKLAKPTVLGGQDHKFGAGGGGTKYARQWLVTELDFSFGNKFAGAKKLIYLPNTKAEFYLLFPLTGNTWYYGVQTMDSILMDPQLKAKYFAVSVFLPPNSVYMYVTRAKADKKALMGIKGVVLIVNKNNQIIGRKVFAYGKETLSTKDSVALYNAVMNLRKTSKLPITLWPREKTPWQWIEAERFELSALQAEQTAATAAVQSQPQTSAKKAEEDTDEGEE